MGGSNEDILEYLLYQTDYQLAKIDSNFTGVYGYYRGEYLDGNGWDPYADGSMYYPKERPWYIAAVKANGKVGVASPYLDMDTGNIVLSVAQSLMMLLVALIGTLLFFLIRSFRDSRRNMLAQAKEQKSILELQDFSDQLSNYKKAVLSDAIVSLDHR